MDSQLFSLTALPTNLALNVKEISQKLVYSCVCGALLFYVCAGERSTNQQPIFSIPHFIRQL